MATVDDNLITEEEFRRAVDLVNKCTGTVKCGCKIEGEADFLCDCLFVSCRQFERAYRDRFLGGSKI